MTHMIIGDLKAVLRSKRLWIAVGLFVFSAAVNIIEQYTLAGFNLKGGLDFFAFGNMNYVTVLRYMAPFIPAFVLSPLYTDDFNAVRDSSRTTSLRKMIAARSLSSAIIGGGIFIFSYLIILIVCFVIDPSLNAIYFEPWGLFADIYYSNAPLFVLMFFLYTALFGALYGLFSTAVWLLSKNYWMAMALPGIYYYCGRFLWPFFDNPLLSWAKFLPGYAFDFESLVTLWRRATEQGAVLLIAVILIVISYFRLKKEPCKTAEKEINAEG